MTGDLTPAQRANIRAAEDLFRERFGGRSVDDVLRELKGEDHDESAVDLAQAGPQDDQEAPEGDHCS